MRPVPSSTETEDEQRALMLREQVVERGIAALPGERRYRVPGPVSEEEAEEVRAELTTIGRLRAVPGLGAYGDIERTVDRVSYTVLAHNPYHPREDWQVHDSAFDDLRRSMQTQQLAAILCTTIAPDDPRIQRGQLLQVIKGHRRLEVARVDRMENVLVEVLTQPDLQPLTPYQQALAYFVLAKSPKPLATHQVLHVLARLYTTYQEECRKLGKSFQFPTQRELAERFGVGLTTINRAAQILAEQPAVIDAVAAGRVQPKAALAIIQLVPDQSERASVVSDIVAENTRRSRNGQPALTIPEITDQLRARYALVPEASKPTEDQRLGALLLEVCAVARRITARGGTLPVPLLPLIEQMEQPAMRALLEGLAAGSNRTVR